MQPDEPKSPTFYEVVKPFPHEVQGFQLLAEIENTINSHVVPSPKPQKLSQPG